jgi:hypothetical protein
MLTPCCVLVQPRESLLKGYVASWPNGYLALPSCGAPDIHCADEAVATVVQASEIIREVQGQLCFSHVATQQPRLRGFETRNIGARLVG